MRTSLFCPLTGCVEGDIRLAGGTSALEGRVEICTYRTWGTVCDDGWEDRDARVVCRQLRFSVAGMCLVCFTPNVARN